MKPVSLVVMALAMLIGASAVLFLRDPPKKKNAQIDANAAPAPADDEPRSRRTALGRARSEKPREAKVAVDRGCSDLNAQAIQRLDAGATSEAIELFTRAHERCPEEKVFATNLAEALARQAAEELEPGSALELLRRAAALAPDRADLATRVAELDKLARSEDGLWKDESEHFTLAYDGARDELLFQGFEITHALETAYTDLGELFAFHPVERGRAKIKVVLYGKDAFHAVTGIGHWAGGLYDGTVRVPVEDLGREKTTLVRVLRHELVHAFVHAAGGRSVPGWLNEGLAQLHEDVDAARRAARVADARAKAKAGPLIPLAELAGSLGSQKDEARIQQAYAQALAFTAWLSKTWGERVPFEMVAACKDGGTSAQAFETRTGRSLAVALDDFARE